MIEISQKEKEILDYYSEGLTAKQIAKLYSLSPRTIHTYLAAISRKVKKELNSEKIYRGARFIASFYLQNKNLFKVKSKPHRTEKQLRIYWARLERDFLLQSLRQDYSFIGLCDYLG